MTLLNCYSKSGTVLQALANSMLSFLMVLTLLWGGCISCPQFFMFPKTEKSCCNKDGQCERPTKNTPIKECKQMPLELQEFGAAHAELAIAEVLVSTIRFNTMLEPASEAPRSETLGSDHSPPDLNLLHSTLII
jgi:hypothetical protein